MNPRAIAGILTSVLVLLASVASAQSSAERPWGPGTTLSVFVGAASPDSGLAGAAGASVGWEWKPYLALEGSGTWIGEAAGQHQFAAMLGPRVSLFAPRTVVPSIFAGVGMLRASVDVRNPDLPSFYAARSTTEGRNTEVFEDLALAVGAGVDIFLGNHLAIRPDVRLLFVRSDIAHIVMPMFGAHVTYHFEPHPYLPHRGR